MMMNSLKYNEISMENSSISWWDSSVEAQLTSEKPNTEIPMSQAN